MHLRARSAGALAATLALVGCANIQTRDEQYRLPASYNGAFYHEHDRAARSFYAAHYAHFGVYEVALTEGENATAAFDELEAEIRRLVAEPPVFEPPAEIIAPQWTKIAWATGRSMDWTHMLHSQLYDILTDDRVTDKKTAGERAIAYYLSKANSAFSTRGYGHRWMMGGGAWAGAFARAYPGINGVLWGYHWHHAAVYEALMERDPARRRAELGRVIRVFEDSVLAHPPEYMPLTAEVAPRFAELWPAAAHIFDNLHMMHDVVNDIMVYEPLSRAEKALEIERMRRNMLYAGQDVVIAPGMPMAHEGMAMEEGADGHGMPAEGHEGHRMPAEGHEGHGMPAEAHEDHGMPAEAHEGHGMRDGAAADPMMGGHMMAESAFRVPTRLPDGRWLAQGHPRARRASMHELMMPLPPGEPLPMRSDDHEPRPEDHEHHERRDGGAR